MAGTFLRMQRVVILRRAAAFRTPPFVSFAAAAAAGLGRNYIFDIPFFVHKIITELFIYF
jgi:hypothetical protein